MIIERNLNPAGRLTNMMFGLGGIFDGLIRVLSFGFLHTRICLVISRYQAKVAINEAKKALALMRKNKV
jgi:hypothetical protein